MLRASWLMLALVTAALACERQPPDMICPDEPIEMCPWIPEPPGAGG
jgi:hypothetical protein